MPSSFLLHRLEWIPTLGLFVLILGARLFLGTLWFHEASPPPYQYTSPAFAEANGLWSVQKLVQEHCMTDARGLCAASLRDGPARCNRPPLLFDPPFLSVVDQYMDVSSSHCRVTLETASSTTSTSTSTMPPPPPTEKVAMELLLQHILEETYILARLYFRTVPTGPTPPLVDQAGLQNLVTIVLASWWEYYYLPSEQGSEELVVVVRVKDTPMEHSVPLVMGGRYYDTSSELIDRLQHVVDRYSETDMDRSDYFLDASLQEPFFLQEFLSHVQAFCANPVGLPTLEEEEKEQEDPAVDSRTTTSTTTTTTTKKGRRPRPTANLVHNSQLSHCLRQYYSADLLLTTSCHDAMDEARVRLDELAEERKHSRKHNPWWYLPRGYVGFSWVLTLAILWEVHQTATKKILYRSRQCLLGHVVLSLGLWLLQQQCSEGSLFGNASLVSLGGLLGTYYLWSPKDDDDDYDGDDAQAYRPIIAFELPLLNATTRGEEVIDA